MFEAKPRRLAGKSARCAPPEKAFAFFEFPPPNFFFELGKSQVCRVGCPQGQKRRGGLWLWKDYLNLFSKPP